MELGTVKNISHKGLLIVKADHTPKDGTVVLDSSHNEIGRVVRVFGPVGKPYVSIRPVKGMERETIRLLGKKVHVEN